MRGRPVDFRVVALLWNYVMMSPDMPQSPTVVGLSSRSTCMLRRSMLAGGMQWWEGEGLHAGHEVLVAGNLRL